MPATTSAPVSHPRARAWLAAASLCVLAGMAHADPQADRIQALEQRLNQSLQLIEALTQRLAVLERGAAAPAAALPAAPPGAVAVAKGTSSAVDPAQEITSLKATVAQLSDSLGQRNLDTGLPIHGFADVGAAWSRGDDPHQLRGFNAGTMDLYLTPQFGSRVKSLIELALEYDGHGELHVDLERLQLGYTVSDSLTLWLGRFHTPIGLWNTAFHHGANLQTSIYRPRFIDFEDKGGVLPAHSVGLWATGKLNLGADKLNFDAFVANGSRISGRTLDFNPSTDNDSNKLVGLNLAYSPGGAGSGLTLGLHALGGKVDSLDAGDGLIGATTLRMAGAYFSVDSDNWEALGEYYRFSNTDRGTGLRHRSQAWFVQLGKSLDPWTPFVRVERSALAGADLFFASQASGRSYRRVSAGLRYALDPRAALKLEISRSAEPAAVLVDETGASLPLDAKSYRRASLQYSVAF